MSQVLEEAGGQLVGVASPKLLLNRRSAANAASGSPAVVTSAPIEGFSGLVEVITDPLTRKFFRKLHDQWPWAGFFLHVQPITLDSSAEDIIDLSVFMAIALCQLEEISSIVTPRGIGLHFDTAPLRLHLCNVRERAAHLAEAVDIPAAAIEERDNQICESVASFFRARQKPHP